MFVVFSAWDIIKHISCRFLCSMENNQENTLLNRFQKLLSASKPSNIKKVTPFIDYQESRKDNENYLIATVIVKMETDYFYADVPWLGDASSFATEEEKEAVKKEMTDYILEILEGDLETDYLKNYWKDRDLRQEEWKRKGE